MPTWVRCGSSHGFRIQGAHVRSKVHFWSSFRFIVEDFQDFEFCHVFRRKFCVSRMKFFGFHMKFVNFGQFSKIFVFEKNVFSWFLIKSYVSLCGFFTKKKFYQNQHFFDFTQKFLYLKLHLEISRDAQLQTPNNIIATPPTFLRATTL